MDKDILENFLKKLKQTNELCHYIENCYKPPAAPFRGGVRDIYMYIKDLLKKHLQI